MVFFGPVNIHHISWLIPLRSAYFFSTGTESRSGSTEKDRNCTKAVSVFFLTSFNLNPSWSAFMFFVRVGQIDGQRVKKKLATMILPFMSSKETSLPS